MTEYILSDKVYTRHQLEEYCNQHHAEAPEWERSHLAFINEWLADTTDILVKTSGSTGEPKAIALDKSVMENSARLTATYFRLTEDATVLLCLPSSYIAGKMVIVRALVNNWNLWWTEPSSNPLADFNKKVDMVSITPMQALVILKESPEKLNAIPIVLVGGSAIPDSLVEGLRGFTNEVYATYGMTETASHVAVRLLNGPKRGDYFQALPGVRFSMNEQGCLVIEASHLNGIRIVTKDLVDLANPYMFRFLGRADNVINSGGIKIHPEKIEEKIAQLVECSFFLIGEEDEVLGEKLVMYLEQESQGDSDLLRLRSAMKLLLNKHEFPKEIRFTPKFARTESGKIIRKKY